MRNKMVPTSNSLKLDIVKIEEKITSALSGNQISDKEISDLKYELEQMIDNISFVIERSCKMY